jgi:Mg-chelatase subunit ChlD
MPVPTTPVRPRATALFLALLAAAHAASAMPPWPEKARRPLPPPQWQVRTAPDFEAPSAANCARPVTTREVPGRVPSSQDSRWPSPAAEARRREEAGSRADLAKAREADAGPAPSSAIPPAAPAPFPVPQRSQPNAPADGPVTAGVVDDNEDFASYLAFRQRTHVKHRARDVRERHLLVVRDARGRGVSDAEVAVQAPNGAAMWARTDAGGRAWIHPAAFDPSRSPGYAVTVRKQGRYASTQLQRGQKSAVEVTLDARAAEPRARLDLLFLIDATGSMADEIDKLKATLRTIVGELSALPSRPELCLGLVAYRDKHDEFLLRAHDFTDDPQQFLAQALTPLRAAGGGDYPEAMNEALNEAVHRMSWRGEGATRLVILLADAPPQLGYGGPQYDDDMLAALGKGIKVFGVGASGLDRQGEYVQRQIAQYTGGKFVFLTYAQASNPASGPGRETVHDVKNYSVDTLDRLVVRLVSQELAQLAAP